MANPLVLNPLIGHSGPFSAFAAWLLHSSLVVGADFKLVSFVVTVLRVLFKMGFASLRALISVSMAASSSEEAASEASC